MSSDLALLCMCLQFIIFSLFQFNVKFCLFDEACSAAKGKRPPKDAPEGDIFFGVLGEVRLDLLKEQRGRPWREKLLMLTCSFVLFA